MHWALRIPQGDVQTNRQMLSSPRKIHELKSMAKKL